MCILVDILEFIWVFGGIWVDSFDLFSLTGDCLGLLMPPQAQARRLCTLHRLSTFYRCTSLVSNGPREPLVSSHVCSMSCCIFLHNLVHTLDPAFLLCSGKKCCFFPCHQWQLDQDQVIDGISFFFFFHFLWCFNLHFPQVGQFADCSHIIISSIEWNLDLNLSHCRMCCRMLWAVEKF